jgi:hypothetical protein
MLRRNAANTVFATVQEPWRESTESMVAAVKRLPVLADKKAVADHEAYSLEVTRRDGSRTVFFVNYSAGAKTVGDVTTKADVATWNITPAGAVHKVARASLTRSRTRQGLAFPCPGQPLATSATCGKGDKAARSTEVVVRDYE